VSQDHVFCSNALAGGETSPSAAAGPRGSDVQAAGGAAQAAGFSPKRAEGLDTLVVGAGLTG